MSKVLKILEDSISKSKHVVDELLDLDLDWTIIKDFMTTKSFAKNLTPHQEVKLKRYQFIYNQLVEEQYNEIDVIKTLELLYDIDRTQAYIDIRDTKELFGTTIKLNKSLEIKLQLEINRTMLRKAKEIGDLKVYAALEKNRSTLIAMIETVSDHPADNFEGHTYEPIFEPSLLGVEPVNIVTVIETINAKHGRKINTKLFEELNENKDPL